MPSERDVHKSDQPKTPNSASEATLEAVLDRYLEELAEGRAPDQESYLRAHPDLSDALRGVFRTLDFVEATSKALNASKLEQGQRLGEFRIIKEVGRGGMGVVYEAIQTSLNRRVALKVLPAGVLLSDSAPERFAREAATAGRLHHSNIVPVYAVGEEQGIQYYAMQYIEGRSLAEHLKKMRAGVIKPGRDYYRRVAHWGRQVAEALEHAHTAGTIHRDIKPSNLLLDANDNVWVTDFGLAREDALSTITVTGDVVGTARYMSPEQARGGRSQLDGRTDIYSLGATLYELLTLSPAYDGESRADVLNRIVFDDSPRLRQVVPSLPLDLDTIVGKCMEKIPARRYQTAHALAEDCRRFADDDPIHARRTPLIVKAVRYVAKRRMQAAAIVLTVGLLLVTVWLGTKIRNVRAQQLVDEAYQAYLFEQDASRATQLLDRAGEMGIDSAEYYLYRGLIPLMNAQPQRAIVPLMQVLQRDPENIEARYALACAYFATGDTVNGNRYFELNTEVEITTALGWLLRGFALNEVQPEAALESYNQALQLRPDFTPAIRASVNYRANRLLTCGAREELEPMLGAFDAWVTFWPRSSASYSARASGWLYAAAYAGSQPDLVGQRRQWLANCRLDLDQAEALSPDSMTVLAKRGTYLRFIGDWPGAAEAFQRAMQADRLLDSESHPGLVHHRVLALYAMGNFEQALVEITPICDVLPTFFAPALQRALLLAELGRLDEALAQTRETVLANEENDAVLAAAVPFLELFGGTEALSEVLAEHFPSGEMARPSPPPGGASKEAYHDYLVHGISADQLVATVVKNPARCCECMFLIGMHKLSQGDRRAARESFQACLDSGVFIYIQHRLAQVFLARMDADQSWPGWVADNP